MPLFEREDRPNAVEVRVTFSKMYPKKDQGWSFLGLGLARKAPQFRESDSDLRRTRSAFLLFNTVLFQKLPKTRDILLYSGTISKSSLVGCFIFQKIIGVQFRDSFRP